MILSLCLLLTRGFGFFIGIDFVSDRTTRNPATAKAKIILDQMLLRADIILSLDGPYENVMKFKPPLTFNKENAEYLIENLDKILTELGTRNHL